MLVIRQNVSKIQLMTLSTSVVRPRKDPLKQYKKKLQDKKLEKIQKADPFVTNVGMRHQLKNMDLPDPEDPVFQIFDNSVDITKNLESIVSESDIEHRKMTEKIPRKVYMDKDEIRRAIVKKKYFPDPKEPQLLTWMEKEIMKKLHKEDPLTWTYEQLSECFPITPKMVKKVLKNTGPLPPNQIVKHNEKVRENWKLLSKNTLENSEPILKHLETVGHKIFAEGIEKFVPSGQRQELEQKILEDYSASLKPVKPKLTGPYGTILVNHQKRVGKWKDESENVVEVENLLNSDDDFRESLNQPSPFLGTARINTGNSSYMDNKFYTVDKFRQLFYREFKKKAKTSEDAKKYFKWLKTENNFLEKSEEKAPEKLLQGTIENVETDLNSIKDERNVKKYKETTKRDENIVLKSKSKMEIKEKIDIPIDLHKENAVYQIGDCFYDSSGEFLHRIPGVFPEK